MAKVLRAIKPNAGIRAAYRRELLAFVRAMTEDVQKAMKAEYKSLTPEIAQDAAPGAALERRLNAIMARLKAGWLDRAESLAERIMRRIAVRVLNNRRNIFKGFNLAISPNPGRAMRNVMQSCIAQNVALIKSIPETYATRITEIVQNGVAFGRNIKQVNDEILAVGKSTVGRANLIARDQVNKATQAMTMAGDRDLGVSEGVWVHVPGRDSSRPTHIAMNGKRFDLSKGLYDSAVKKNVVPGELPLCACVYRPVIPGWGE